MAEKQTPEEKVAEENKKANDARNKIIDEIVEKFQKELETNGYESMKQLFKDVSTKVDTLQLVTVGAHVVPPEPEKNKQAQTKPAFTPSNK